jgi:Rps23 Pro-64 3,4-dihydroxylase Tpa1-like proline 4-hydroxylase
MYENVVNLGSLVDALSKFRNVGPFNHCVIDNFFPIEIANKLSEEFMPYDNESWHFYNNSIENKKTCNDWNKFPEMTYRVFSYLNSEAFVRLIAEVVGIQPLYPDVGLHGGGWHCHSAGGILNPHLDYSIHPKMGLERVLNLIVYLSPDLKEEHGGHLGLWSHNSETNQPDKLVSEIAPKFNRAVFFNTTQNSWHGISRALVQPDGIYRKSIAVYYVKRPNPEANPRGKALFAPTDQQKDDPNVLELIKLRSDITTSAQVYKGL